MAMPQRIYLGCYPHQTALDSWPLAWSLFHLLYRAGNKQGYGQSVFSGRN